ncbi:hypothetical protein PybrP1_000837 [[Pythium] brassicae (nom. inval.)]|nr:hypothetical protein PybrP1_000837 [[Pythium] brassicae (nom. inval.)]
MAPGDFRTGRRTCCGVCIPNTTQCVDVVGYEGELDSDHQPAIVTEYASGGDLDSYLRLYQHRCFVLGTGIESRGCLLGANFVVARAHGRSAVRHQERRVEPGLHPARARDLLASVQRQSTRRSRLPDHER